MNYSFKIDKNSEDQPAQAYRYWVKQQAPLLTDTQSESESESDREMASRYWVVSLPVQNSAASVWNRLQEQISKHSFDTPLYRVRLDLSHLQLFFLLFLFHSQFFFFNFYYEFRFCFLQFNIPNLRVGTLDSLLALSDDLVKVFEFFLAGFIIFFPSILIEFCVSLSINEFQM